MRPGPRAGARTDTGPATPLRTVTADTVALVPFRHAPFPCALAAPGQVRPFFDIEHAGRRGHTARDGRVYWEHETYCDNRVLVAIPADFDPRQPATLVVYLHGNLATLERDVCARQQLPAQVARAAINAVLLAPQFALDAPDSSPGAFAHPGKFARFLDEAADRLGPLLRPRLAQHQRRPDFSTAAVIIVAYSGGYLAAACALSRGHASRRVRGVLLLDALYGNEADFANWLSRERRHAFFVSAYGADTRAANDRLAALLEVAEVPHRRVLPPQLTAGTASFVDLGSAADHAGFANRAWTDDPITDALRRAGLAHRQRRTSPPATLSPSLRNCRNRHPTIPPR